MVAITTRSRKAPVVSGAGDAFAGAAGAISATPDGWIGDLRWMIACDTSFPPGNGYAAFADGMEAVFAPLGFRFERVEVPPELCRVPGRPPGGPRINLIARRRTGRPVCSIYFHVDVVPPGDGWTGDPFILRQDGDRLIGRGTADMKGTIAATLLALRVAAEHDLPLAHDPVLLFCTDEEGGLYPGVRHLAERGLIEGHVLCLNGGAMPRIWAGCFGSLDLEVTILGRAAHSGDGREGVNAVEAALPVLNALIALKGEVETRASTMPAPPHFGERPLTARLSVTAVHAGDKGSALPGACRILVNRRFTPDEELDAVKAELETTIREAAATTPALGVEIAVAGLLMPVLDPDGDRYWPAWREALSFGFGFQPDSFRRWGAASSSDMGFVQQAGIREILLGGLSRPDRNVHGADEYTTIGDVRSLARAILFHLAGRGGGQNNGGRP